MKNSQNSNKMKPFFRKRKTWKWIGFSVLTFFFLIGSIIIYFWTTFLHIPNPTKPVQFESLGDKLSGELIVPNEISGPFPAVILLHGSGRETREDEAFTTQAKAFLKKGFAVLIYDKRGTGMSGGTFRQADFKSFITDIHSALDFMQAQPNINPDAIGLATNSESGYFAPQLASERPDIAFIYNRVGPVIDVKTLNIYQIGLRMEKLHNNPKDVEEIMGVYEGIIDYFIQSDQNPDYFNSARSDLEKRIAASWDKFGSNLPYGRKIVYTKYDSALVHRIAYNRTYDPRVFFEKRFDTPLFYAFAEHDVNVPTDLSVASLDKIIKKNQHNVEYRVWPGVGHQMIKASNLFYGLYPKGYLDEMTNWAKEAIDNKLSQRSIAK